MGPTSGASNACGRHRRRRRRRARSRALLLDGAAADAAHCEAIDALGRTKMRMLLSPRTVEWHLRHVFMKLGISSRRQLRLALADAAGN